MNVIDRDGRGGDTVPQNPWNQPFQPPDIFNISPLSDYGEDIINGEILAELMTDYINDEIDKLIEENPELEEELESVRGDLTSIYSEFGDMAREVSGNLIKISIGLGCGTLGGAIGTYICPGVGTGAGFVGGCYYSLVLTNNMDDWSNTTWMNGWSSKPEY